MLTSVRGVPPLWVGVLRPLPSATPRRHHRRIQIVPWPMPGLRTLKLGPMMKGEVELPKAASLSWHSTVTGGTLSSMS